MTDSASQLTLGLSVPQDHPSFAGHFPGDPLVPGALLLRWMIERLQQEHLAVYLIKQCKFLNIIRPGDQLQLQVTLNSGDILAKSGDGMNGEAPKGNADGGSLVVAISCGSTPVAKAQCLYHLQDTPHG